MISFFLGEYFRVSKIAFWDERFTRTVDQKPTKLLKSSICIDLSQMLLSLPLISGLDDQNFDINIA